MTLRSVCEHYAITSVEPSADDDKVWLKTFRQICLICCERRPHMQNFNCVFFIVCFWPKLMLDLCADEKVSCPGVPRLLEKSNSVHAK